MAEYSTIIAAACDKATDSPYEWLAREFSIESFDAPPGLNVPMFHKTAYWRKLSHDLHKAHNLAHVDGMQVITSSARHSLDPHLPGEP